MSLGKRERETQAAIWIETASLATPGGHPFYERLNGLLRERKFDTFAESVCRRFYSKTGRPGLSPAIYFRLLLVGYFEGIDSERGIAWRAADSLALRWFLGYELVGLTGRIPWNRAWIAPVNGIVGGLAAGMLWSFVIFFVYAPLFHRGKRRGDAAGDAADTIGLLLLIAIGLLTGFTIAFATFAVHPAEGQLIWNWWRR